MLPFRADDLDSRRPDDGLCKWTTNFGEHLPVLTVKWRMSVSVEARRSSGTNGGGGYVILRYFNGSRVYANARVNDGYRWGLPSGY